MQMDKEALLNKQYKNSENLSTRQAIFDYSENPTSIWEWAAQLYPILPHNKILEVGCGNGVFWRDAVKIFPKDINITVSDFSPGMLDAAQKTLCDIPNLSFSVQDTEDLWFATDTFDVVLAHFVLHHANAPHRALSEIKRVLKPTGFLGVISPSKNHMQTLFSIVGCENPRQSFFFSAEETMDALPVHFQSVEQHIYKDTIKIDEAQPLINYIRSLSEMKSKPKEFYSSCEKRLANYINKNGFITLDSHQSLFIAR